MTVCFDLDGTLLYTLEDLHNALNHSLKKYGYKEVSLDETRLNVGNGIRNLIIDSAKSSDNIDLMFSEFKKYYEVHCTDNTLPYIGMVKLVSDLKNMGYKIACVSNKHYVTLNKLINYYFPNMFDIVLGDGMGYERKPNPNSCLLFAKAPLFGFCVAIIPKFLFILYFFKTLPDDSTLKILLSNAC